MLKFINRYSLVPVMFALLFMACAKTQTTPMPVFKAQPVDAARYEKKVEHLVFVMDASSSMADPYLGHEKMNIATSVIRNFNSTMPDLDLNVSILSFGHDDSISLKSSEMLLPDQTYSRTDVAAAIDRVQKAGGPSIMRRSFEEAAAALENVDDAISMIIISDGEVNPETLDAANALHAKHEERLCIHTILVGGEAEGAELMNRMAALTPCGEAATAESLSSAEAMNAYVKSVLVSAKKDSDADGVVDDMDRCESTPQHVDVDGFGCPLDDDGDRVANYRDNCPGTPAGTKVDNAGCAIPVAVAPVATKSAVVTAEGTWLYNKIKFESGKAKLKSSSSGELNEILNGLNTQPGLMLEIQGHTDARGSREYNLALSQKRADAVKAYLVSRDIAPSRLTVRGFGPDRPIASNDTAAGRAANRRVELKPAQ